MTLKERFRALIGQLTGTEEKMGYQDLNSYLHTMLPITQEYSTGHEGAASGRREQFLWLENGACLHTDTRYEQMGQGQLRTSTVVLCSMDDPQGITLYSESQNSLGAVTRQGIAEEQLAQLEAVVERLDEMSRTEVTRETALAYFKAPGASVSAFQGLSEQLRSDPEVARGALALFYKECQCIHTAQQMDSGHTAWQQDARQEGDEATLFLERVRGEAYMLGLNRHFTPEQMDRMAVEALVQEGRQDALTDLSARYEKTQRMLEDAPRLRKELAMREEQLHLQEKAEEQQQKLTAARQEQRRIEEGIREVNQRSYNWLQRLFRPNWTRDQQARDNSDRNNWEVSQRQNEAELRQRESALLETEDRLGIVSRQVTPASNRYKDTADFDRRMEAGSQFLASVSPLYWAYKTFIKDQNQQETQTQTEDQVITETEATRTQAQTAIQVVG